MNDGSNALNDLLDSVRKTQHASWTNGENVLVETLLEEHPALRREESRVELIYAEFCLREAIGDDVAPADYLSRFPDCFDRLQRLFEVHEALESESPHITRSLSTGAIDDVSTDAFATRALAPTEAIELHSASRIADYELLEEVARGGMGVVYKAWQRGADRVVALKMILAGRFASEIEVQRFHIEAKAAARLDHVNIVPIFSVGEHEQHQYFSMAYIDGESLAHRVARGPLDPREASRLVRDIANGIHYAHQHGIAHRDLKPANILLTDEGVPKITDFGLAKRLESDGPTVTGDILGTPAYMAPENVDGNASQSEALGDVYSLGAILYCLLTGRPPFQAATVVETLAQVAGRDPVAPRQLNQSIDRDLQTICLKCLEKQPSKRYDTAAELAHDLGRFLNGEPIRARSISGVERLWRWCKRNPRVSTLATVSILLASILIATLAGGYALETKLRQEADEARQLSDANAETARGQADLALHTLERIVFDIQRRLEHVPAAQSVRHDMLVAVIEQLDLVASNLATNDLADHHTAVAHVELGDIFLSINAPGDTNGVERARREYEMANRAFQKMHEADPNNDFLQHNLAISYGKLAKIEQTLGHMKEALRLQDQGYELLDELCQQFTGNATYAKSLAAAHGCLGEFRFNLGEVQSARDAHEQSRAILQELRNADAGNKEYQRSLAVTYNFLGTIYLRQSKLQLARESYEASLALREQLASTSESVNNLEAQFDLAIGLRRFGDVLLQQSNVEQAGHYYQRSVAVLTRAAKSDPSHKVVQQQLASSHSKLGELALRTGDLSLAKRHFEHVEQIDSELVRRDPDSFFDRMDLAAAKQQLGDALKRGGDLQTATRLYGEALSILDDLRSRGDGSNLVLENIAATCLRLGEALQRSGDLKAAIQLYERQLTVARELATLDPTDTTTERGVSVALGRLGDLRLQCLEIDDAFSFYEESLGIARRLANAASDDRHAQRDLFVSFGRIANVYTARGEHALAIKAFLEAVEIAKELAAADSLDEQAHEDLASAYSGLSGSRRSTGDVVAAREALEMSLATRERLAQGEKEDADAQYNLSLSHEQLFDLHWEMGEIGMARPHISACAEIRERLAAISPLDARLMRARMVAMDRQALVCESDGDVAAVQQLYERGIRLLEEILAVDPSAVQPRIDFVGLAFRLGYAQQRRFDFTAARNCFERGLLTLQGLKAEGVLEQQAALKPYLQHFSDHIEVCTFYERVATDLEFTLAQDKQRVGYLLYERSQILSQRGSYDEAATTLETLAELEPDDAENLYSAACGYGLCVLALDKQSRPQALTDADSALRRQFATRAIELLDAAALGGYFRESERANWLMQDPDFSALREEYDFQRFVRAND
ncbi:MAG: protein kinase [Planctomycetes bacterium]|nr:protein kinase [Planctomycetota bacterium]